MKRKTSIGERGARIALCACLLAAGCTTAEPPQLGVAASDARDATYQRPAGEDRDAAFREVTWEEMNVVQKTFTVVLWPVGKLFQGLYYGVSRAFLGYDDEKVKRENP